VDEREEADAVSEHETDIPTTLRKIVKAKKEHGIYLLEGDDLIFFPA